MQSYSSSSFHERLTGLIEWLSEPGFNDSPEIYFDRREAARTWQIITMLYNGSNTMYTQLRCSGEYVSFKVYSKEKQKQVYLKETFEMERHQQDLLRQILMKNIGKASQKDREFAAQCFGRTYIAA
tara:strand:- start:23359 stop:23736 length:378 start_codon:yes stop_codon:yes gene_type:complete